MPESAIEKLLRSDEVAGRIIRDAAMLESFLGTLLEIYFAKKDKSLEFGELVMERMSFAERIDILRRLKLKKRYKSLECVKTLDRIRKLRNVVAHTFYVDDSELERLLIDKEIERLLVDYPAAYRREVGLTKKRIISLAAAKDFS